jgi:hypothetical protein
MITQNEKGIMLIWFYMLFVIIMITAGSMFEMSFHETRIANIDQAQDKAFYLAESAIDQKLKEIRANNFAAIAATSLGAGTYSAVYCGPYGTSCGDSANPQIAKITATGTVGGISKTIIAVVQKKIPGVRGAISANEDVELNGSISVDGRDHDADGNLIAGEPGTYGISSGGTINQTGSSDIGGNGFAPTQPANPAAIQENATTDVYTTPEAALGLEPGSLDAYKTSSEPATPFNGIVYFTGNEWNAPNFGSASAPSTGILIVHNTSASAVLKNIHGTFKGLIIADDLIHINGDAEIIGGVILQKSTGNTVGNGSALVKFSSAVLNGLSHATFMIVGWQDQQNH